jgi:hypothetical protein
MVNFSTTNNFSKTTNHLSPLTIKHKKTTKYGAGNPEHNHVVGLNGLMGFQPPLKKLIANDTAYKNKQLKTCTDSPLLTKNTCYHKNGWQYKTFTEQ